MNIDIEKVEEIRNELESLEEDEVMFIEEDHIAKYAVMPISFYDAIEDIIAMMNGTSESSVRIAIPQDFDLSYDEYERIKQQIMDAVEKTFMPKPEKLN